MSRLFVVFCLWLPAAALPAAQGGLQRLLDARLARFPAKAGIYVRHLSTGEQAAVRGGDTFNSASVIKIPVMVLAYQLAEQGKLDLDARVPVTKDDFRAGSGVLRYHDAGLQPTVGDLITQMIITSDNTATDMLIAQVGGVARVNAWLAASGYARFGPVVVAFLTNAIREPYAEMEDRMGRTTRAIVDYFDGARVP